MATKKITLDIEGMHCGSCAAGIQMYLENTEGVKSSFIDYNTRKGEVEFEEGKLKTDDILKGIEGLGYKAKVTELP